MKHQFIFLSLFVFSACAQKSSDNEVHESKGHHEHATTQTHAQEDPFQLPKNAKVFFVNLQNGQQITSPVYVKMGVEGMKVVPSGQVVDGTGHHHILVDRGDFIPQKTMVPADSAHIHFGGGQTETYLNLSPGKHKLALQFADGIHRSYGKALSATVDITVK